MISKSLFLTPLILSFFYLNSFATDNIKTAPISPISTPPTSNYLHTQILKPAAQNLTDVSAYVTSPLRWNSDEWLTAGSIAGITGLLILVDKPIFDYFDPKNLHDVNNATDVFFKLGDKFIVLYGLSGMFATGLALNDNKLQHATYLAFKSFGFQIITTQFFKDLFLRRKNGDPYQFEGPQWNFPSDEGALPSGHAGFVWAVLTSYAEEYRQDEPLVADLCYASATISSLTLMTTQSHWVSDIFMGAAIGYYTALSVRDMDKKNPAFTVYPILFGTGYGVGVTQRF